jgi:hypothetical protein
MDLMAGGDRAPTVDQVSSLAATMMLVPYIAPADADASLAGGGP